MAIGIVKMKFTAVLLGPSGMGLSGTFMAMKVFASTLAGMGISQSGVRDISEARGSEDAHRIAETIAVIRKLSLWLGLIGALVIVAMAWPLSQMTFGDESHALGIMALGIAVLMGVISAAQGALLQGFRNIADMAKSGIYGTLISAPSSVAWYYYLGLEGIIPAILTQAFLSLCLTWFYARRVKIESVTLTWAELLPHAKSLLSLGLAFMWNGLLLAGMAYVIRMIILNEFGLASVGIYGAAFGISGMVINFVLSAMSADYFPRLSEVSSDHSRMNQLVNEQAEIGVLLALPAISGLILFAPCLVRILYTPEFLPAVPMIQWFALGCFGRVLMWPLGFVVLAKKKGRLFAGSQTFFQLQHLLIIYVLMHLMELEGVAVAFALHHLCAFGIILLMAKHLIQFQWFPGARKLLLIGVGVVFGSVVLTQNLRGYLALIIGFMVSCVVCIFCLHGIVNRIGRENQLVAKVLRSLPFLNKFI